MFLAMYSAATIVGAIIKYFIERGGFYKTFFSFNKLCSKFSC